jgi:Protein of unknown function (DUF1360)
VSHVPDWWAALLLAAAAFRVWRLLAYDSILDRPRAWVVGSHVTGDRYLATSGREEIREVKRPKFAEFVQCPWCFGFWIALAWWAAWLAAPHWTLVAAAPFALSAAVGLLARLDP